MKNWLMRFMAGRYGSDQLSRFLSIAACVVLVLSMIFSGYAGMVLWLIAMVCLVLSTFRMFSKNTAKRYQENAKYLAVQNKFTGWFRRKKERVAQSKNYRFYRCPQCGITTRIPKGKGKIKITCPKCGNSFIRKS